jgi:hypothetical protein
MQSHLQDHGLGADNELGRSGEPDVTSDLARLLMWYLEPPRIGWFKRRHLAAARGRAITGTLHRWLIHET